MPLSVHLTVFSQTTQGNLFAGPGLVSTSNELASKIIDSKKKVLAYFQNQCPCFFSLLDLSLQF